MAMDSSDIISLHHAMQNLMKRNAELEKKTMRLEAELLEEKMKREQVTKLLINAQTILKMEVVEEKKKSYHIQQELVATHKAASKEASKAKEKEVQLKRKIASLVVQAKQQEEHLTGILNKQEELKKGLFELSQELESTSVAYEGTVKTLEEKSAAIHTLTTALEIEKLSKEDLERENAELLDALDDTTDMLLQQTISLLDYCIV